MSFANFLPFFKVTHTFDADLLKYVKSVWFYHQGQNTEEMEGPFGSKMTGGFVKLCLK